MDALPPTMIKALLEKYGAKPSKGLGQNFLIDGNILEKIIEAAQLQPSDTVVEVGPGLGILTKALAAKVSKVVAMEKDRKMVEILTTELQQYSNVTVIQGDALEVDLQPEGPYKVVANIPYYITSPLIRKFLESPRQPENIILMIQKEVAQRICAKVPDMSLLAVSVQYYATPKLVATVSKNSFWPAPKIDSAIIKITPKPFDAAQGLAPAKFFAVVRAGFSQPRKQLTNNLSKSLNLPRPTVETWLQQANIHPTQRAETLTIEDWIALSQTTPTLE